MLPALSSRYSLPVLATLLAAPSLAFQGTATFDTLSEGPMPATFVEGGITFFNFDNLTGSTPGMMIERADGASLSYGFSAPNCLGFTSLTPGPGATFGRIKVVCMTTGQLETDARLSLFESGSGAGNTIALEALRNNAVVLSTSLTTPGGAGLHAYSLWISGVSFDTLRLIGSGANDQGCFFGLVDDVSIGSPAGFPTFCTGDGLDPNVTAQCPCGNVGAAGHGCASSVSAQGAELSLTALVPASPPYDVVLHGAGMPFTTSCIYVKSDLRILAGHVLGDGLGCLAGSLLHLATKQNVNGASQFPGAGDPSLSSSGGTPIGSGLPAYYQVYYRNALATYCGPATFNVTNGIILTW